MRRVCLLTLLRPFSVSQVTVPANHRRSKVIWSKLETIDAFSVGASYLLATEEGETTSPWSGMEETLPLLLTAVADGRLIIEDIRLRLHDKL